MSSTQVLDQILLYKKKVLKYSAEENEDKILYYIHKLKGLPVSIKHLEATDIGKVVNALTNNEGLVGSKCSSLIKKWKAMVQEEEDRLAKESRQKESHASNLRVEEIDEPEPLSEPDYDSDDGSCLQIEENRESDREDNYNIYKDKNDDTDSQNGYNPLTSRQDYLNAGQNNSNSSYSPSKCYSYGNSGSPTICNSPDSNGNLNSILDDEAISLRPSHKSKKRSKEDKSKHKEEKNRHKSDRSKSKEERSKNKEDRNASKHDKSKKKDKNHLTVPNEKDSSQLSSPSSKEKDTSPHKHSDTKEKDRHRSKEHKKKEHKHRRSKSDENKGKDHKKKSKEASSELHEASNKHRKEHSKSKSNHEGSRSSHHSKEKLSTNDLKTQSSKKRNDTSHLEQTQHSSKKKKKLLNETFDITAVKQEEAPCLLSSYKPLPKVPEKLPSKDAQKSHTANEEGLNFMFSLKKKRQRTMYTGNSSGVSSNISSLNEMCIKVLLENLDALRGKDFHEVRLVLERASPQQLLDIEYYNPYLLEDTSYLWELHCKKLFKAQRRQEMETWRDMFHRCTYEYQEKLKNVTKNLQRKYVTKAEPKRTTQLAYVNPNQKQARSLARAKVSTYPSDHEVLKQDRHHPVTPAAARQERNIQKPQVKKTRMAPLMAKTLQLHKKVCRR